MLNGDETLIALNLLLKGSNKRDEPAGKVSAIINLSCLLSNFPSIFTHYEFGLRLKFARRGYIWLTWTPIFQGSSNHELDRIAPCNSANTVGAASKVSAMLPTSSGTDAMKADSNPYRNRSPEPRRDLWRTQAHRTQAQRKLDETPEGPKTIWI